MAGRRIPTHTRAEIIARTAAGETVRDIAKATGVSTQTVNHHQHAAEWQPLLAILRDQHRATLQKLYQESLTVVGDALKAKDLRGKPDHETRLKGANTARRILEAGDRAAIASRQADAAQVAAASAARNSFTIEELGHRIARDRGLIPPEDEGPVIEVEPLEGDE